MNRADVCMFEMSAETEAGGGRAMRIQLRSKSRDKGREGERGGTWCSFLLPFKPNGPHLPDKDTYSKCFGTPELPSFCCVMKGSTVGDH